MYDVPRIPPKLKRSWPAAGLFLAGLPAVYIYLRACGLGFFADDFLFIELLANKGRGFFAGYFCRLMDGAFFRPAAAVPWYIGHAAGNSAFVHHFINVVVHVLNSFLTGLLCFEILLRLAGSDRSRALTGGILSAVIFLFSPVQSEAVFWVSGRFDLLCVLFALLGYLAYLAHIARPAAAFLVLIFLFVLLCLLSKETGISFVLALLALEFLKRGGHSEAGRKRGPRRSSAYVLKELFPRASAVVAGLFFYLLFRVWFQEDPLGAGGLLERSVPDLFEHAWIAMGHLTAPVWPGENGDLLPRWVFVFAFAVFVLLFLSKDVRRRYHLFVLALLVFPLLPALFYEWHPEEWVGSRLLYPVLPGWSILWGSGLAYCLLSRSRKRPAALALFCGYVLICVLQLHFNLSAFQSADAKVKNVLDCLSRADISASTEKVYLWDFPERDRGVMLFFRDVALTAATRRALPEEKTGKRYWGRRIFAYHAGRTGEETYIMELPGPGDLKNKRSLVIKWDKEKSESEDISAVLRNAYISRDRLIAKSSSALSPLRLARAGAEGYFPVNHLIKDQGAAYRITGGDPFFFTRPLELDPMLVKDVKIKMKIRVAGGVPPGYVQLYWRSKGNSFTESLSAVLPVAPGESIWESSVPLGKIPDFVLQKNIEQLRLDPPKEADYVEIIELTLVPVISGPPE